jgi:hypothetical protein
MPKQPLAKRRRFLTNDVNGYTTTRSEYGPELTSRVTDEVKEPLIPYIIRN